MKYADVTYYGIIKNYTKTHKPVIILILIKAYVITLMFTGMHDTTHTVSILCYTPDDWM